MSTGNAPQSKNETYLHKERLMSMYDLPGLYSDEEPSNFAYQSPQKNLNGLTLLNFDSSSRIKQNHSMLPRLAKANT